MMMKVVTVIIIIIITGYHLSTVLIYLVRTLMNVIIP